MLIVAANIVRNAGGYLDRYLAQVEALRTALGERGHELRVRVVEGDSTDDTFDRLVSATMQHAGMSIWRHDHGGPAFGSIDDPVRWANVARTWNYLLDRIRVEAFDALILAEADLIWQPGVMLQLLGHLASVPAVAPMVMMDGIFYDTWGHRAQGQHFTNAAPFHPALVHNRGELMQIDSAGNCIVMRGDVAKACRLCEQDAMLGHDIYARGYSLWLDPTVRVDHP